jgi:hypothetical protein
MARGTSGLQKIIETSPLADSGLPTLATLRAKGVSVSYPGHNDTLTASKPISHPSPPNAPKHPGGGGLVHGPAAKGKTKHFLCSLLLHSKDGSQVTLCSGQTRYCWEPCEGCTSVLRLERMIVGGTVFGQPAEGYALWSDTLPRTSHLPLSKDRHLPASLRSVGGNLALCPEQFRPTAEDHRVFHAYSEQCDCGHGFPTSHTLVLNYGSCSTWMWCQGGHLWDRQIPFDPARHQGHNTILVGSWNEKLSLVEAMLGFEWSARSDQSQAVVNIGAMVADNL